LKAFLAFVCPLKLDVLASELSYETMDVDPELSYQEQPMKILDRREKELRNKVIPLVKVLWRNHAVEEATWELEEDMRKNFPALF